MQQELTKRCKQCGKMLPVDAFKQYMPRGRGIYVTSQGRHTLCMTCEAISAKASRALRKNDEESIRVLVDYYKELENRGLPPVTAPAKRLLGYDTSERRHQELSVEQLKDALQQNLAETAIERHCRLVRERGYASFDEADEVHRALVDDLRACGLYAEINALMEEWFLED